MIHLERKTKKIYQNISISVPWTNSSESTAREPNKSISTLLAGAGAANKKQKDIMNIEYKA